MRPRALAAAFTIALAGAPLPALWAGPATVRLRGGEPPIENATIEFATAGVRVSRVDGPARVIAWDLVAAVDDRTLDQSERAWLEIAEELWRARFRVQRGDLAAARPLLEKHFDRFRGETSEIALIVAEGLLRCRLADGEWEQAIVPALEAARLRRAGVVSDRFDRLAPVIDDATLLAPALAPSWQPDPRLEMLAEGLERGEYGDAGVRRIAELYATLLRGGTVAAGRENDPGAALLAAIAAIDAATPEGIARSRRDLAAATKNLGPWAKAWSGYALGRSLVASADPALRLDGVLELLRVAADDRAGASDASTGLGRRSLLLAIGTLRELGDAESAAILERELAGLASPRVMPASSRGASG